MQTLIFILLGLITVVWSGTIPKPIVGNGEHRDKRDRSMHPDNVLLQQKPKQSQSRQAAAELTSDYWLNNAKKFVQDQMNKKQNKNIAKNIILFLGDGMSTVTTAATRPYIGGEEKSLFFEDFPGVGMAKTYCVNYQVPDSACTSTAYLGGVKGNYGTLGLTSKVPRYDCTGQLDPTTHVPSIAQWARKAGKVAGLVTTAAVTDASPAGLYAHSANRYWENDVEIVSNGCDPNVLTDIAKQLILSEDGSHFRVIMGGGRQEFRPTTVRDEENRAGLRTDGRDLISEWMELKSASTAKFIWNTTDLLAIDPAQTDYLLGLFEYTDMRYYKEVVEQNLQAAEPSLAQMTEKAIDILSKNEEGFFLFVEGARIDHAHHGGYARLALDETAEFSKAIELARRKLSEEDTLIVVTADHSHTMSYAGYPYRNADIFGTAEVSREDNMPYMTLNYANGPGYPNHMNGTSRVDVRTLNTADTRFRFPAALQLSSETHAGEDVAVYASGPWAHLFTGNYEQNVIPYMMGYASCIGDGILKACD